MHCVKTMYSTEKELFRPAPASAAPALAFVISSLTSGGAERVMTQLANQAAESGLRVELIVLSKKPHFFELHPDIRWWEPDFTIDQMHRLQFQWKDFWWLRHRLRQIEAEAVLSFGGKYNVFVLLASTGLGKKVFVSDRSRPSISYGRFLDRLNPRVYPRAAGIIAQTQRGKEVLEHKTGHKNIRVIPNPIPLVGSGSALREPLILNVGRFITSKHQDWLVDYFNALGPERWRLTFLGEGPQYEKVKKYASSTALARRIAFMGNVTDVDTYYRRASIFAFTSTSEGFPNALGEAMSAGCACISFDCEAGPADLIEDGKTGFLVSEGDHQGFKEKLHRLIADASLREQMGRCAMESMKAFRADRIAQQYFDFMLSA
jgi:GalNAc-alpha-(1->4)-GalNAc-alpha-(1->3)-diNAcBac-PP-undecaprenol alpha-1,4-N-acetyl-D-galactosaminyltransferase